MSGARLRARRVSSTLASATRSGARAGAATGRGTGRLIHRMTSASGAGRTGLGNLIELTAAGSAGDAFVTVALAGTLFFNTSLDQARSQVALYLLVTMAPFAVLAPFIGPMLDRLQSGRRFILAGTLLARGLLCWGMAAALHKPITLFPAAFGVLVLQKAYAVTRSSVAPKLLPAEITLVKANARTSLASLIASSLGAVIAVGIDAAGGAAWVLGVGTLIYLGAAALGVRLPNSVDSPGATETSPRAPASPRGPSQANPATPGGPAPGRPPSFDGLAGAAAGAAGAGGAAGGNGQPWTAGRPGSTKPLRKPDRRRFRTLRDVGPVVGEAMRGNAAVRAFNGFMLFFLVFLLRTTNFHGMSHIRALGALAVAVAAGGFLGTAVGSGLRTRTPHLIVFGMLVALTVVTAVCAWFFGLWAALGVAFAAALAQALVKLALDSTVQREIGEEIRSSTFAVSETLNQLSWVLGGLAGLAMSFTASGVAGLTVAATGLAAAFVLLLAARRRRVLATGQRSTPRAAR
jgi:Major Facilitator Superfamily